MRRSRIFDIGGLLLTASVFLLAALPLAEFGGFDDSLVYFEQAKLLWDNGLINGAELIASQTGKIEPGYLFVLWVQQFIYPADNRYLFLVVNGMLVNILLGLLYLNIARARGDLLLSRFQFFVFGIVCVVGYYGYSNSLYVWRTVYALMFFLLFILKESSFKRTLYLFGAFLFHFSTILFLLVYLAGMAVVRVSKGNKVLIILYLILIGGSMYLMVFKTTFWGVLLSGGAVADLYTRAATLSEFIKRVIIVAPLLLLLLLIPCERRLLDLWAFCVGGLIFSLFLIESWQLSWRISVASMVYGVAFVASSRRYLVGKIFLLFTILPTGRLMYLLLVGDFLPGG